MTEQNTQVEVVETTEIQTAIAQVKGFTVYTFDSKELAQNVLSTLTEEVLSDKVFTHCGKFDAIKTGFTPFEGEGANFLLTVKGSSMFQITTQVKKPHGATIKKLCKAAEIKYKADNDVEAVDKETKDIIKMGVIEELLPTTTPEDPKTTLLWVSGKHLIVGEGSYKKSEDIVCFVRATVGSIPVEPIGVNEDVQQKLTDMLLKGYDETVVLLNLVHLTNEDSKGVIKFEKESIYDVDVKKHLDEGCLVSKMQLSYNLEMDFTLNKDFEFTGVKVDKEVLAGSADLGAMIITVDQVNKTVEEVVEVFGGESVNEEE